MNVEGLKARFRHAPALQPARKVYHTGRHLREMRPVLSGLADLGRYWMLHTQRLPAGSALVPLRVRDLGDATVLCRPGTTDERVLYDTFRSQFHMPARPLRRDALVLDLGANVGYTASHFAVLAPEGRVIAVEMDAANAAVAERNLARFGSRCTVVHAAVWDTETHVSYDATDSWGFRVSQGAREFTVAAKTVESILHSLGLDDQQIDYVKMDIEGAEGTVLANAGAWLDRAQAITVEIHDPVTYAQCEGWLSQRGFACRAHSRHWSAVVAERAEGAAAGAAGKRH